MANIRTNVPNSSLTRPKSMGKRIGAGLAAAAFGLVSFSSFGQGEFWLGLLFGFLTLAAIGFMAEGSETLS